MNIRNLLWEVARSDRKQALPILSFPAAQKLGVSVEELVKSADLQAQAIVLVAKETPTLAGISLMDLSVEAEAFGAQVRFARNEVPAIVGQLVSDADEANALEVPQLSAGRAMLCVEAVRKAKAAITDKPLLAGMIGPYSLAGRLCDVTEIMYLCFDEPETVHTVLDKATCYLIRYGQAMKDAGADGIMMAEPLAGILSPDMAADFSVPYVQRIIAALQDEDFAVIYHNCGNAVPQMLDELYSQGAAAYHFGNAVNMAQIMASTPEDILVMGNIDPAGQFAGGTEESITAATRELMKTCGRYPNFIPSSGCDIPAHASWKNIHAFFKVFEG
ncbi:MAG: uroporphyrinogen decarboxylase family protein [Clostridia bacterium]|nr:uroporphyrinogen decarboxylase family protein [Clostridia bacterium]